MKHLWNGPSSVTEANILTQRFSRAPQVILDSKDSFPLQNVMWLAVVISWQYPKEDFHEKHMLPLPSPCLRWGQGLSNGSRAELSVGEWAASPGVPEGIQLWNPQSNSRPTPGFSYLGEVLHSMGRTSKWVVVAVKVTDFYSNLMILYQPHNNIQRQETRTGRHCGLCFMLNI